MGVPKQKWTVEEEDALKAGVVRHGSGKWRTILKDPEFCRILHLRSNVDLKDKWRNLGSSPNGSGTREKARVSKRKSKSVIRHDDNSMALNAKVGDLDDHDIVDVEPLAVARDSVHIDEPKVFFSRCDDIWDVISSQHAVSIVQRVLQRHDDPERCARELVTEALRLNTFDRCRGLFIEDAQRVPTIVQAEKAKELQPVCGCPVQPEECSMDKNESWNYWLE